MKVEKEVEVKKEKEKLKEDFDIALLTLSIPDLTPLPSLPLPLPPPHTPLILLPFLLMESILSKSKPIENVKKPNQIKSYETKAVVVRLSYPNTIAFPSFSPSSSFNMRKP